MSRPPPPPNAITPPDPIGDRYRFLEVGGRGGMAVVWRAEQLGPGSFGRSVAIKQMHPHLAEQRLYRQMFCEEARLMAALADANVPQIHEFLEERGELFLVMEWIDGVDLASYVRYVCEIEERPARWDLVCAVGVGVLRGLAAAHERADAEGVPHPIVHRDISPHNILISSAGKAKLIDFGLGLADDRTVEDTAPGVAKGKLPYLAPEIVRGAKATPLADQFAVGATLWEALAGHKAFEAESEYETYRRVANAEVGRIEEVRPDLPVELSALVHRALALEPDDRFPDAREMARQLGRVLSQSKAEEDTYRALGRTVIRARAGLGIGRSTMDPSVAEPIQAELSGMTELRSAASQPEGGGLGWMPAMWRRLTGKK